VPEPRPFDTAYTRFGIPFSAGLTHFPESASVELVEEMLREEAELPSIGRERFSGTLAQRNAYWREYAAFITQARSYLNAASLMKDHTSALLYYYAAMNLAKAELIKHDQSTPLGFKWMHGLTHRTDTSVKAIRDSVSAQVDGVFPRLYEKRTGTSLGRRSIPVTKIIRNIPEISSQAGAAGFGPSTNSDVCAALLLDDNEAWSIVGILDLISASNTATMRAINRSFKAVDSTPMLGQILGIRPNHLRYFKFFESRLKVAHGTSEGSRDAALDRVSVDLVAATSGLIESSVNSRPNFTLTASALSSENVPLPPSLARYAAFFYGSSVVRYRPTRLSASFDPEANYLFDALCRESVLPLMLDALVGLRGVTVGFSPEPSFVA